jgi:ferredoxin-NADP reductase
MTRDIHCVTKWSKLNTPWTGVLIDDVLADAGLEPPTAFMLAHSVDGYSTNVPVADLVRGKAMIATHYEGQPLTAEHGGPARLLVPHLYFWKSAKWISGLQFTSATSRVLGAARLPRLRRSLARAALLGRLSMRAPALEALPGFLAAGCRRAHRSADGEGEELLSPPGTFVSFRAGQHLDVRLSAPDGYQAQRSYSVASAPGLSGTYEIVVERLGDGEVSPFLHDVAEIGDTLEIRGPFGGHFAWGPEDGGPLLLVGGGSGVAPLMSILRHRAEIGAEVPVVLLQGARTWDEVIFREELLARERAESGFTLLLSLSRDTARRPQDAARRIDATLLQAALDRLGAAPRLTFACGSNGFVEGVAGHLLDAGLDPSAIRTERFGG